MGITIRSDDRLGKHMMAAFDARTSVHPRLSMALASSLPLTCLKRRLRQSGSLDLELLPDRQPGATTRFVGLPASWRESLREILPL